MKPTSNKHLNIFDRVTIQDMFDAGFSFTAIANAIGKHRTTISREVKEHRIKKNPVSYSLRRTPCIHRNSCHFVCNACDINLLSFL